MKKDKSQEFEILKIADVPVSSFLINYPADIFGKGREQPSTKEKAGKSSFHSFSKINDEVELDHKFSRKRYSSSESRI